MALSPLFPFSERTRALHAELAAFIRDRVLPAEAEFDAHLEQPGQRWTIPPVIETLKAEAKQRGLWNLFLPDPHHGAGLSNLDYAPLAELSGQSLIAPETINCNAPDTGNMEVLHHYGSPQQQERWLQPLELRETITTVAEDLYDCQDWNLYKANTDQEHQAIRRIYARYPPN